MMLSSDRDAYLHMSIGCVILSQEFSSACLSVVIIEQLVSTTCVPAVSYYVATMMSENFLHEQGTSA